MDEQPRTSATSGRRGLWAVTLAVALLAAACGSSDGAEGSEPTEVRSEVKRISATKDETEIGAGVVRTVGATLYPLLADDDPEANLAFSPASIAIALGMARGGAASLSAEQLDTFLGSTDADALHRGLNGLSATLESRSGKAVPEQKDDERTIDLSLANSFWGQSDVKWKQPFLDLLGREYGVGMNEVDYIADPEGARDDVNVWVAKETHDEIPELIPPEVFNELTRLTLVNALYLAAPWADEFDKAGNKPFTTAAGKTVKAPAMHQFVEDSSYAKDDGWQAVTIPYLGGDLAMVVVLPDEGRLADVEATLDAVRLEALMSPPDEARGAVDLTMPLFDIDTRPGLLDALGEAGVKAPFDKDRDDFKAITTDPTAAPLHIADVLHQATVKVDEKGTVAAAATAVVFEEVGMPMPVAQVDVNRPFLFLIVDRPTRTPLFVGRVTDPTKP